MIGYRFKHRQTHHTVKVKQIEASGRIQIIDLDNGNREWYDPERFHSEFRPKLEVLYKEVNREQPMA